jgi:O-glycosyl hydrolase
LSYQWYQVEIDENGKFVIDTATGLPKMTLLEGETTDSFVPDPANLQLGVNYFFVEVTHTVGTSSVSEFSAPAKVTVLPGLRAAPPVIIEQPKAGLYFDQAAITALTVEAESTDLGTLSYQWYSNTSATTVGGTAASGATGKNFTPVVAADASVYYYVVVTNTNDNVEGEKTAATASRAVNVRRTSAANVGTVHSTIQIGDPADPANRFNYIRGYGGMEVLWGNFPETYPEDTELMYDPNSLGYNMLRVMIPPTDTDIDANMLDAVTRLRPHYYDNVKIVNKYNGYVLASPWSPPKEWKSNNSVNGGGILRREYYQQFADYLKAFAQHMYNRGAPIYAISISNEPNYTAGYDGCEWEPEDTARFFKQVGHFTSGVKGYGGGRQIPRVLVMNGESANTPFFNTGGTTTVGTGGVLMDPDARKYVDLFARHIYGNRPLNLWAAGWDNSNPIEIWMTEHNINSANATAYPNDSTWDYIWRYMNDVDLTMRLNNENAFVWWASKRFYSMVGDGQYGTPEGTALPRGWGLSHYSKYTIDTTRIGFTMTGATADGAAISYTKQADGRDADTNKEVNGAEGDMDNTTARITAYVSQDGSEISLIMWTPTNTTGSGGINMGTIQINMPDGFLIASATGIRSYKESPQRNVYHEVYNVPIAADRKSAYVTLPASEIISVKFTR